MTSRLRLSKHHGLGNDFLVVLAALQDGDVALPGASDAVRLCDRHRGIGADGLIVARHPGSDGADLAMELFNADGSVAEISGNGIRCLAQAELDRRGERSGSIVVDTAAGRRQLTAWDDGDPDALTVRVDMGVVATYDRLPFDESLLPDVALHVGAASVGNPHLVIDVGAAAAVSEFDIERVGSALDTATTGGINVHVVAVADDALVVRHWERGAGMTEACGSGATAAATLMAHWGLAGVRTEVAMPGGSVIVDVPSGEGGSAFLEGPTVKVADIEVRATPQVLDAVRKVGVGG